MSNTFTSAVINNSNAVKPSPYLQAQISINEATTPSSMQKQPIHDLGEASFLSSEYWHNANKNHA